MKDSRRSHFVTVTGVILMICAIIGTLVSGGVFVFVFSITAVNGQDLSVAATEFADSEDIVPLAAFILRNLKALVAGSFVTMVLWFFTSAYLLARKNWARRGTIVFLILIVVVNVSRVALAYSTRNSMIAPPGIDPVALEQAATTALWNDILYLIAICGLCFWAALKLTTAEIKREFTQESI